MLHYGKITEIPITMELIALKDDKHIDVIVSVYPLPFNELYNDLAFISLVNYLINYLH